MPQSRLAGSNLSFTYGKPLSNSTDILLSELNEFASYDNDLSQNAAQENLLQYNYQEDREFLYLVQQFDDSGRNRNLLYSEFGIGKIQKIETRFYLKRELSVKSYDGFSISVPISGEPKFLSDQGLIVCSSYIPSEYIETILLPNSVLCSDLTGPVGVDLPNNTVLGRTSGNIQSLDANELRYVLTDANITNAVESSTGNYTFLCQTLNLANSNSRLSSAALQARPVYNTSNHPAPQRGTIIYNEQTNRFEGYDGTTWREFAWASGIGLPYV